MPEAESLLPGVLLSILLFAVLLVAPLSLLLLRLYRRAVFRQMNNASELAAIWTAEAPPATSGTIAGWRPLNVVTATDQTPLDEHSLDRTLYRHALGAPWRNAAIYAAGGLAFAAVVILIGASLLPAPEGVKPLQFLVYLWPYLWPVAIMLLLIAASNRRQRTAVVLGYFSVFVVLTAVELALSPTLRWWELPYYWGLSAGVPTVLLLALVLRPVRAVGPAVLTLLLFAGVGAATALALAGSSDAAVRMAAGASIGAGTSGYAIGLVLLAGAVPGGAIGWLVVRWLGNRYRAKRFGDQLLILDSMWILFAIMCGMDFYFEGAVWALTGLAAFVAYKLVTFAGFSLMNAAAMAPPPKHLLLLRAFTLGEKSERLFDDLRLHWQHIGSIAMIAGPDLVTRAIEPHELVEFLSGRLGRQFVLDNADLEQRLERLDRRPDPDGRYRVSEFFCHDNTWQATMQRLAATCDTVLMDLRGFGRENMGCTFEIGALVAGVDLEKVLFLTDATTDRRLLHGTLQEQWVSSSAYRFSHPAAYTLQIDELSGRSVKTLLKLLLGARIPGVVQEPGVRTTDIAA